MGKKINNNNLRKQLLCNQTSRCAYLLAQSHNKKFNTLNKLANSIELITMFLLTFPKTKNTIYNTINYKFLFLLFAYITLILLYISIIPKPNENKLTEIEFKWNYQKHNNGNNSESPVESQYEKRLDKPIQPKLKNERRKEENKTLNNKENIKNVTF